MASTSTSTVLQLSEETLESCKELQEDELLALEVGAVALVQDSASRLLILLDTGYLRNELFLLA